MTPERTSQGRSGAPLADIVTRPVRSRVLSKYAQTVGSAVRGAVVCPDRADPADCPTEPGSNR
jgi:hypothetical protein